MKIETAVFSGTYVSSAQKDWTDLAPSHSRLGWFTVCKRAVDLGFALLSLPILLVTMVVLYAVNPIWNPGAVFFCQSRMGRDGKAFTMMKFRTMTDNGMTVRAADAPLDDHRITPLGQLLRRTKLDELPNILNILTGDMSLVGPRPDAFEHATEYLARVPHYRKRFCVRPGITGLAQVRGGYADNLRAVHRKARYDSYYIKNRSFQLEMSIIASTFGVVFSGFGQR